jgi:hypothetical protein
LNGDIYIASFGNGASGSQIRAIAGKDAPYSIDKSFPMDFQPFVPYRLVVTFFDGGVRYRGTKQDSLNPLFDETAPLAGFAIHQIQSVRLFALDTSYFDPSWIDDVSISATSPFSIWQASHFTASQLSNPGLSGWNGDASSSGIPNGLKFFFDLNATGAMTASDSSALPHAGVEFSGGLQYLTLTYRQNPEASTANIQLQVSSDLTPNSWLPVTPDLTQSLTPDSVTGDPRIKVMVNVTGQTRKFIRLQVTGP